MTKKTYRSEIAGALHDMMNGFYEAGAISQSQMREFDESCLAPIEPLTPTQIKAIPEETHASPTVFARYLNVSPLVISQWESGQRKPSGPSLKLLTLVKNKGLECLT